MRAHGQPPGDAERVLTQALRAMAGGPGRPDNAPGSRTPSPGDGQVPGGRSGSDGAGAADRQGVDGAHAGRARLTVLQIMLAAILIGLLVGMTVGVLTLLG